MKMYCAQRSFPRTGEAVCAVTVVEGWQRQRVALPLRTAPAAGDAHAHPLGFDWGYVGAAPRELARALLADCFGRKWAARPDVYEALMEEVVAGLAKSGWELSERDLTGWAHEWALGHGERELAALAEIVYVRVSAH